MLLLLAGLAGRAAAADGAAAECNLEARGGRLLARVDLRPAFPDEMRRTFASGLTNVVALHVALLPEHGDEPAALFGRELEIRYDVWEEIFAVTVRDPASPRGRRTTARTWADLRELLGDARDLDLGPVAALGSGSWRLQARLEVNPISRELLERTREFIANPPSGVRGGAPSRSVLGAMASYLLQGSEGSEARFFASRTFTAREVRAP
jgi:hypothetical protein